MGGLVKEITAKRDAAAEEFRNVLASNQYVIVDFSATWCQPCRQIAPIYDNLAQQLSIPGYFAFVKIDIDDQPELAAQFEIRSVPSFAFFKDSKRVKVNGIYTLQGGPGLNEAAAKMGALAKEKAAAAGARR
jgi:thioredoxin 1